MFCPATVHSFAEISLEVITENQTCGMTELLELNVHWNSAVWDLDSETG